MFRPSLHPHHTIPNNKQNKVENLADIMEFKPNQCYHRKACTKGKTMQIYPFSPLWLITIVLSFTIIHSIKQTYKNKPIEKRKNFIKNFNIFVILFWITYKWTLSKDPSYDFIFWNELPLHLCNVTCILFLIASIKDWNLLRGLCFFTGTLGILFAFIMPDTNFSYISLFSYRGIGYWGYHALMLIQSMSLVTLNIIQPDSKDVTRILILLALLCLTIHGVNLILRATVYDQANYFYTFGIPGNIIMDFLIQKIPYPFLFMTPILVPLWIVCNLISKVIQNLKDKEKVA